MIPDDHLEFLHAVWTRRTPFTFIFLGVNIAIFILMELSGGTTNPGTLMAFGVKSNPEIVSGEWWRLVMPIFIHIGLLHLFFNSYALWMVGQQVEKLYGSAQFVILYVLTGVAGVLGSFFYNPQTISAGASGAIMGLFGVLLVFGLRYRDSIPPFFKQTVGTGVLPVILINLVIGFTVPAIDNSAHISGLLSGAALAAVIPFQKPGTSTSAFFKFVQMGLLGIVLVSFYTVGSHYHGPSVGLVDAVNNAQQTFEKTTNALAQDRTGDLPPLIDQVSESIRQLRSVPSMEATVDGLVKSLQQVMEEQYAILQDVDRAGTTTFAHSRRLRENVSRYESVMRSFSGWVDAHGHKYGIRR